jgi:UDP-glucose 4-epimerase
MAFVRQSAGASERQVADYADIGPVELAGFDVVINCAGAVAGSSAELDRANVDLPRSLARACCEAGVEALIHVSSFAVYGDARTISSTSPPNPRSEYGRSKLRGDEALLELTDGTGPTVILVRLPAIVDPAKPDGKVARLVRAWRGVGIMPMPLGDIRRSMISARLASRVLSAVSVGAASQVLLAADPEPFSYGRAAEAIGKAAGARVRTLPLPGAALIPLRILAPSLYSSLYGDSVLEPSSNVAAGWDSDLYETIEALAAEGPAR